MSESTVASAPEAPAPPLPPTGTTEDRTMPAVVYGLYLLGFATGGATTLLGLIIAYVGRGDAKPVTASHYTFLINTFWMTFGWFLIGGLLVLFGAPLSFVLIGLPFFGLGLAILSLVGLWYAVRAIVGVIYLARGEAYPRPKTWLV
jgi:uncharacterized membrane protein